MSPSKTLQLPPPSNWPDFEELCWELWKEIWQDPGTSRNGRPGQAQQGVDISGRPKNGKKWAGVQCKGKDNYADKCLTVKELREEAHKALTFEPKLSEFIVATSGPKDAKVEKEARLITAEHRKHKLFSVSVFGWQDILDRLAEHPDIRSRNYPEIYGTIGEMVETVQEISVQTKNAAAARAATYVPANVTGSPFPNPRRGGPLWPPSYHECHEPQKQNLHRQKKTGKPLTEYGTECEAKEAAKYASDEYRRALTPYLCQVCGRWHLSPANRQTPSKKCAFCAGSDGQPKDAYATEQDAKRRASIIRKESGVSLRAYPCQYGNGWHLTKSDHAKAPKHSHPN